MAGLGVYRAMSRVFPHSFRAKLMAVVLGCTVLPLALFVLWLLADDAVSQRVAMLAVAALAITLVGTALALYLIHHLLAPLRLMAGVADAYVNERQLPHLPEDGRDEVGLLMRAINCGLRELDGTIEEMRRLALEDPLTHALSRRGTERQLLECIVLAETEGVPLMLYVVDVDNLKPVNDEFGHAAGDRMLVDLVERTREWLEGRDWIGRWGGDEFLVCLHAAADDANDRVERWLRDLGRPGEDRMPIRVSVGCAPYRPGLDAMQLYREADAAMYTAKARGGGVLVCDDGVRAAAS
jgi:diguanylate cyclase (GGDEF)-like protein